MGILYNNIGDDNYNAVNREWASNPIKCNELKVFLADESQLQQVMEIRSFNSNGVQEKRQIAFQKYVSAKDPNSLIVNIPLVPDIIIDGKTSFKIKIPALSQIKLMFFYNRKEGNEAEIVAE